VAGLARRGKKCQTGDYGEKRETSASQARHEKRKRNRLTEGSLGKFGLRDRAGKGKRGGIMRSHLYSRGHSERCFEDKGADGASLGQAERGV